MKKKTVTYKGTKFGVLRRSKKASKLGVSGTRKILSGKLKGKSALWW